MQNIFIFSYLGITIVMVIVAFILGRRSSNSHTNHNTTNASDFVDIGANDAHHDHNHENADHGTSKGFSHVDSGS